MDQRGKELRAEVAQMLHEREALNFEVERLRARMKELTRNLEKLLRTHGSHLPSPWTPAPPSNVIPLKREK